MTLGSPGFGVPPLIVAWLVVAGLSTLVVRRGAVDRAPARRVLLAKLVVALGAAPLIATLGWYLMPRAGSDGIGLVIPALMVVGLASATAFIVRAWLVLRDRAGQSKHTVARTLTVLAAAPMLLCLPSHLASADAPEDEVWLALRVLGLVGAAAAAVAVVAVRRPAVGAPACFVALAAYPSVLQPLFLLGPVLVAGAPMLLLATVLHLDRPTDRGSTRCPADSIR